MLPTAHDEPEGAEKPVADTDTERQSAEVRLTEVELTFIDYLVDKAIKEWMAG